jgi:diguanylate cyclase (GGDEF)-like protein
VTQRAYLETLGQRRETLAYFEARLRIGRAHERVGLAPTYYLCAYSRLYQIIGARLAPRLPPDEATSVCLVVQRLFWLDADLAMTAYHGKRHDAVIESVRHDPLTGVSSRAFLLAQLAEECARSDRFSRPFAVVFIDLDGFKLVNDEAGHDAGDRILATVGHAIRLGVRPADIVGRYGGDEFVIGVVEGTVETAREIAERISAQIAARLATEPRRPTASFGIAVKQGGEDATALVHRADVAMYTAKRAGKNQTVVAAE